MRRLRTWSLQPPLANTPASPPHSLAHLIFSYLLATTSLAGSARAISRISYLKMPFTSASTQSSAGDLVTLLTYQTSKVSSTEGTKPKTPCFPHRVFDMSDQLDTSSFLAPRDFLQAFYLTASAAILLVYLIPALNKRFLPYGARDPAQPVAGKDGSVQTFDPATGHPQVSALLDRIANAKVPHGWFIHFYIVSVLSSAFWAYQILTCGRLYGFFASFVPGSYDPNACFRLAVCWALLAIQGMRRLYECLLQPSGSSKMWIGHYAIGIAFYLATGIAIWIEGLPALKAFHSPESDYETSKPSEIEPLTSFKYFAYILFIGASVEQHRVHKYLASLRKYTMPTHASFQRIVAPHYTHECVIYTCLAFLSRPSGRYLNRTMTAALIFVIINLGISADGTKNWMRSKFGNQSVIKKWRMVPGIW